MTKMTETMFFTIIYTMLFIMFTLITNYFNMNSMIIMLILYALSIFSILSLWTKNFMYSIIMFLTLISGLLIIFLYFTSLISNTKNNFYFHNMLNMLFTMNIFFQLNVTYFNKKFTNLYPFFSHMNFNCPNSLYKMNLTNNLNNETFSNIFNLYLYPYNNMTLLCMFFLLLSMFSIIKICSFKSASLRKIK